MSHGALGILFLFVGTAGRSAMASAGTIEQTRYFGAGRQQRTIRTRRHLRRSPGGQIAASWPPLRRKRNME
jgi:hypothetical protein